MCIQSPPPPRFGFLYRITSGIFGYFRRVFHVSREIDSHEGGRIRARHVEGIMTHYRK